MNELLEQYIQELDAVKISSGLSAILQISQQGSFILRSDKLDYSLADNHPEKCAAVVGLAINLVQLIACIIAPYMPDTATAINRQLRISSLVIPDQWTADSIQPGHEICTAEYLFTRIKITESSRMAKKNRW